MHKANYTEVLAEDPKQARAREREVLQRAIDLLQVAKMKGASSREALEAINYVSRLWATLMDDLSRSDNDLPRELRAHLISIGIWVLREADNIRLGRSDNFQGLIDVSALISEGLK
jgi:flagellar biosynthesis activator protein FlaF